MPADSLLLMYYSCETFDIGTPICC